MTEHQIRIGDLRRHEDGLFRCWMVTLYAICSCLWGCGREDSVSTSDSLALPTSLATTDRTESTVIDFVIEPGFQWVEFENMAVFPADMTTAATWSHAGEEITCTGKPKCYLHTTIPFGNGMLRFDYRFDIESKPLPVDDKSAVLNTGVLLFVQEPHRLWPKSIEVQGKYSEMGQLRPNGGAVAVTYRDAPDVRESSRQGVLNWNPVEIVMHDGAITVSITGHVVARGEPGELRSGLIGLQSEGSRVQFRRLRFSPE